MQAADRLDSTLSDLVSAGRFRGAVRIERGGSVLLDAAYGSDAASTILTPRTAFQIASISKTFTAASVLLLHDRGRLSLEDTPASWIAGAPLTWGDITIRHLLTHTSGLGNWHDIAGLDLHRGTPPAELIARFAAAPRRFEPGGRWSYSSPGYVVLAQIVEAAAGAPYPAFLESELLRPLELLQTSVAEPSPGVVAANGSRAGAPTRSFELWSSNSGTGDVWSTTADLARWPRALASSELLSAASRADMFTQQVHVAGQDDGLTDVGYGYGWFTANCDGRRVVFHPGDQPGFTSMLVWAPEPDLVIALLAADEIDIGPLVLPALPDLLAEAT